MTGLSIVDYRIRLSVAVAHEIVTILVNEKIKAHMILSARTLIRYVSKPLPAASIAGREHLI